MSNKIDPALIGRHRATIETWNLNGKRIFTVKAEPADLKYNDQVKENDSTRTLKPIMKYFIEAIDIYANRLVLLPDNATLVVELNDDPSLQFKLEPAKFADVTMDKIKEALDINKNSGAVLGRTPIFFRDCIKLTEHINKLNAYEAAKADAIAENMLQISKFLSDLNKEHMNSCDRYYEELGLEAGK